MIGIIRNWKTRLAARRDRRKLPRDLDVEVLDTIARMRPFTMTSPERIASLCAAIRYVVAQRIPGAFVECGVWKGGSAMAAAETLLRLRDTSRELWLYDTFEGMTEPSDCDVAITGESAAELFARHKQTTHENSWCAAGLDEVRRNLALTRYPAEKIRYIAGKVEDTIPTVAPDSIALLRLDTDWYESTRHELEHLFPRLSSGGVLIIDDYGHWQGARRAVDEYLAKNAVPLLLNRIDSTGRIGVYHPWVGKSNLQEANHEARKVA